MPSRSSNLVQPRILIVDGDREHSSRWKLQLEREGYLVATAASVEETRSQLKQELFDLVIADPHVRDKSGSDAAMVCRDCDPSLTLLKMVPFSVLEPHPAGASAELRDSIAKPLRRDDLLNSIERALDSSRLRCQARDLRRKLGVGPSFNAIVGNDPRLLAHIERAKALAASDLTILILGESGVGKELMAEAIHAASPRRELPLITAFLSAEPAELQLSALFGHVAGAFTNAKESRRGWFREASRSTLFFDEVGDIIPATQAALLRALDKRLIRAIGADREDRVDVRIISATNRDLAEDLRSGRFRPDLYQRLGGDEAIVIPPLRERLDDIPLLVEHFARNYVGPNRETPTLDANTYAALRRYSWPRNVRELKGKVEHAITLAQNGPIERRHFQLDEASARVEEQNEWGAWMSMPLKAAQAAFTAAYLQQLSERFNGDKTRIAEYSGMDVSSIRRILRSRKIEAESVTENDADVE